LKPPRNYQALHDEHAPAAGQSASQQDQAQVPGQPEADNAHSEPEPTRPTQVRPPSPGWTDSPKMEHQFDSAREFNNWANVTARQASRPDQSAGVAGHEAAAEKARLAGDLEAAKETGQAAERHSPDRNASPPDAAKQEIPSGKAALAEDLKAAKESANETDQNHDPGRSR
jgi:hypothetical protein